MKVQFVTSGFSKGFTAAFLDQLRRFLSRRKNFVMVASDFSAHQKSERYLAQYLREFAQNGLGFAQGMLVDFSVSPRQAVSMIEGADAVWLSGGPTLTQIRHIREYDLADALREREGVTVGMSAGAINMAEQVRLAKDPGDGIDRMCRYEGIGLVDFSIEPHFGDAEKNRLEDVLAAVREADRGFYGLYDESFIVQALGTRTFFGPYRQLHP